MTLVRFAPTTNTAEKNHTGNCGCSPDFDIYETENGFALRADVPGWKREEMKIVLEDNMLKVTGTREKSEENDDRKYFLRERRSGDFSRSFRIAKDILVKDVKARIENGVLEIDLVKEVPEEKKERLIEIS